MDNIRSDDAELGGGIELQTLCLLVLLLLLLLLLRKRPPDLSESSFSSEIAMKGSQSLRSVRRTFSTRNNDDT